MPNFIEIGQAVAEISRFFHFQDGGQRPSTFLNSGNLNGWQCPESRDASQCEVLSKFVKRLLRYPNFSIFQDGGRPPSWICLPFLDHARSIFGSLYWCAKFGWIPCSSFNNMKFSIFGAFGLKTSIHAPKIGVFGRFDPLSTKSREGTSLRESASFE